MDGRREDVHQTQLLKSDAASRPKRSTHVFISIFHSFDNTLGGPSSPTLNWGGHKDLREDLKEATFSKAQCHTAVSISDRPTKSLAYIWKWVWGKARAEKGEEGNRNRSKVLSSVCVWGGGGVGRAVAVNGELILRGYVSPLTVVSPATSPSS